MEVLIGAVFLAVFSGTALMLWLLRGRGAAQAELAAARLRAVTDSLPGAAPEVRPVVLEERPMSSIPWLDRLLRRLDVFGYLRMLLGQAQLAWTPTGFLGRSAAVWLAFSLLVYWRTEALALSILAGAAAALIPAAYVLQMRKRHFDAFEQMLPEALDLMVSALRAGHGIVAAIGAVGKEMAGPVGREFRQCFEEQNYGLDMRVSLMNLVARVPTGDVRLIVTAFLVQRESGGNLAEVLERVAGIIRERFRLRRQVQVHTAQGRLTGWILGLLPVGLGFLLYLANPQNMSLLWTHPLGQKMLYGAVVLMLLGILVIRSIVRVRL